MFISSDPHLSSDLTVHASLLPPAKLFSRSPYDVQKLQKMKKKRSLIRTLPPLTSPRKSFSFKTLIRKTLLFAKTESRALNRKATKTQQQKQWMPPPQVSYRSLPPFISLTSLIFPPTKYWYLRFRHNHQLQIMKIIGSAKYGNIFINHFRGDVSIWNS